LENKKVIKRITIYGIIVNLVLAMFKFFVGTIGNSQVMIADAAHSLSDLTTDLAILWGVKYWSAPPDAKHQYGHQKMEAIITMFIALTLLLVAVGITIKASQSLLHPTHEEVGWIAITGSIVSIFLKEIIFRITKKAADKTGSSALLANAWHHRSDALSSIPAFIAILLTLIHPMFRIADFIGALFVTLFILKVAFDILKPSFDCLLDRGMIKEDIIKIEKKISMIESVKSMHALRSRRTNVGYFVDLHIQVDGNMSVTEGHDVAGLVKAELLESGFGIIDVVVHIEPFE
jgi:cation diffusion facilitator family transporter